MKALQLHPLCTMFPRIEGVEFDAFKRDIDENGQRDPIVMYQGAILDGGNRYRALQELHTAPILVEYTGVDPVRFVLSKNLARRDLSPGQRATIVAMVQDWAIAHAQGRPKQVGEEKPARVQVSVAERAATAQVGARTQHKADKVAREAPDLANEVAAGTITLNSAVAQVDERNEIATPPAAAPAPGPVRALKLTLEQRLKKRVADLEGELLAEREAHAETKADLQRLASGAVEQDETIVALQAFRDNEHVLLIQKLQEQVRIIEADRDTGARQREVMVAEIKKLQKTEAKYLKLIAKK